MLITNISENNHRCYHHMDSYIPVVGMGEQPEANYGKIKLDRSLKGMFADY